MKEQESQASVTWYRTALHLIAKTHTIQVVVTWYQITQHCVAFSFVFHSSAGITIATSIIERGFGANFGQPSENTVQTRPTVIYLSFIHGPCRCIFSHEASNFGAIVIPHSEHEVPEYKAYRIALYVIVVRSPECIGYVLVSLSKKSTFCTG